MILHRTPSAATLNHVLRHRPTRIRANQYDIGLITLAQETALSHFEKSGWVVAHQFYETFDGEHALIHEFEHRYQRELDHRHTTGCLRTASLLLRKQMGRMICTNHGDTSIVQCLAKGITIALGLDGRVAFDTGTQRVIVPVAEIQMGDGGFTSEE